MNVIYSHPLAFLSCFKSINSLTNQGSSVIIYHSVTTNISIPFDFIKLQDLSERNNEGRNIKRIFVRMFKRIEFNNINWLKNDCESNLHIFLFFSFPSLYPSNLWFLNRILILFYFLFPRRIKENLTR